MRCPQTDPTGPRRRSAAGGTLPRRVRLAVRADRGTVGIVTDLHSPTYIPVEVCSAVGLAFSTPVDECMGTVLADVAVDGVAAPPADVGGLQQVVAGARERGIDLKVVVMQESPLLDTPLRDVATQVGQAHPGSTVLVVSPGWAGTYSTTYDRVILEAGQDVAKTAPNPVQGAQNFVDQLNTPDFPWIAFTILLVIGVSGAAVATRLLQSWAKRSARVKT